MTNPEITNPFVFDGPIKIKTKKESEWTSSIWNTSGGGGKKLDPGRLGFIRDKHQLVCGDGETLFSQLPRIPQFIIKPAVLSDGTEVDPTDTDNLPDGYKVVDGAFLVLYEVEEQATPLSDNGNSEEPGVMS